MKTAAGSATTFKIESLNEKKRRDGGQHDPAQKLRKIYKSIMDLKNSRRSPARQEKKKADTAHHRIRQHTHQEEMPKLRE